MIVYEILTDHENRYIILEKISPFGRPEDYFKDGSFIFSVRENAREKMLEALDAEGVQYYCFESING